MRDQQQPSRIRGIEACEYLREPGCTLKQVWKTVNHCSSWVRSGSPYGWKTLLFDSARKPALGGHSWFSRWLARSSLTGAYLGMLLKSIAIPSYGKVLAEEYYGVSSLDQRGEQRLSACPLAQEIK